MNFKNEKISFLSTESNMKRAEIVNFLEKKIIEFQDIINETIISVQTYKRLDIIGASELNNCISTLENLYIQLCDIYSPIKEKKKVDVENIINRLCIWEVATNYTLTLKKTYSNF